MQLFITSLSRKNLIRCCYISAPSIHQPLVVISNAVKLFGQIRYCTFDKNAYTEEFLLLLSFAKNYTSQLNAQMTRVRKAFLVENDSKAEIYGLAIKYCSTSLHVIPVKTPTYTRKYTALSSSLPNRRSTLKAYPSMRHD